MLGRDKWAGVPLIYRKKRKVQGGKVTCLRSHRTSKGRARAWHCLIPASGFFPIRWLRLIHQFPRASSSFSKWIQVPETSSTLNSSWLSMCRVHHSWKRRVWDGLLLDSPGDLLSNGHLVGTLNIFLIFCSLGSLCICSQCFTYEGLHWETERCCHLYLQSSFSIPKSMKVVGLCLDKLSFGAYCLRSSGS